MPIPATTSTLLLLASIYGNAYCGFLIGCPSRALGDIVCNISGNYTNLESRLKLISEVRMPDGTRQLTVRVKEDCKKHSAPVAEAEKCATWLQRAVCAFPYHLLITEY